ncbi:MAG: ATP-binding protein [Roseiarcus sp.]
MRPNRLFRATSFRLAALYLAMFTLSVLVLGAVVYFTVGREIEIEFDERVQAEAHTLRAFAKANGIERLAEEVRARTLEAASLDYRLEDGAGRFLAGNLPSPKAADGQIGDGWVLIAQPRAEIDPDADADWERALVTTLDGGAVLVVGHELTGIDEARRAVLVAFAWGLAATLALGTVGGLVLSAGFLRRIDAMSRTAQEIIAGNLRQRIPETGREDDLGRLARTFNRMFDRIEKLVEANRYVSHNIAHDLRKPLTRLMRRLEDVRAQGGDVGDYERTVDAAIEDVEGVLETFNALLRIAQIQAGARRAAFTPLDLAAIARDVAEAFQPAADDENKTLTVETATPLPLAGDKELLSQMVANLVDNALRHTPPGTRIEVGAGMIEGAGALVVADTGPGVPEAERARIFESFYRLDAARAPPGHGLGLSLVAAIAELHGLKIVVADNRPGLRVVLKLPEPARS